MFSFSSFAMIPYNSISNVQTFEDGPWNGFTYKYVGVGSNGNVTGNYSLTGWRDGSGLGDGYYQLGSSGSTRDFYFISGNSYANFTICSYDPLMELYILNLDGSVLCNVLEDAFLVESDGKYFYGMSVFGGVGVGLRTGNTTYITELSPAFNGGSYHDIVMNSLPYLSGVYDGNSSAVKYPGVAWYADIMPLSESYGYWYPVFPVLSLPSRYGSTSIEYSFLNNGGVIHEGSRYTFNYKVYNVPSGNIALAGGDYIAAEVNGNNFTASVDGRDGAVSDLVLGFTLGTSDGPSASCFVYKSSSSDDIGLIPPDDSGSGSGSPDYSSALTSIGSSIKDMAGKLAAGTTTIVNNITNQTTQITNTITNTVTNMTQQITQGLTDVKQGITDKLQGVQQGITDKLGQVQDGINSKLDDVQDEIVNGYDNTGITQENEKLEQSINQYDEVESGIFEDAEGFIGDFEYPSVDSLPLGIIKALAFVGSFLQGIFICMGDFSVIITFSLTMIFVMVVVGYHRIRS